MTRQSVVSGLSTLVGGGDLTLTSSAGLISRMHTSCIEGEPLSPFGDPGNTIAAFGSHEWLNNDSAGETASPICVRFEVVRVCVFVENFQTLAANPKVGL